MAYIYIYIYIYAILGKVSQAFLQSRPTLDSIDIDLTRFLWYGVVSNSHGSYNSMVEVTTYRFTRVPLGLNCSPFLLSVTIQELATMYHSRKCPFEFSPDGLHRALKRYVWYFLQVGNSWQTARSIKRHVISKKRHTSCDQQEASHVM